MFTRLIKNYLFAKLFPFYLFLNFQNFIIIYFMAFPSTLICTNFGSQAIQTNATATKMTVGLYPVSFFNWDGTLQPVHPHFQERTTNSWFLAVLVWTQLRFWRKTVGKTCFLRCRLQFLNIVRFSSTRQLFSSSEEFRVLLAQTKIPICSTQEITGGQTDLPWLLAGKENIA